MATQIYKQQHTFVSMGGYMAARNLCHALKNGNRDAIATAARMMADSIKAMANGQSCVLIPMPGHRGGTGYTLDLCRQISDLTGIPTADILTGNRHMSLNYAKRNDVLATGVPVVISLKSPLPKERVILVDNVLDTGHTAGAAIKAIGRDDTMVAVLSNTVKFKRNFAIEFKQFDNSAILANNNLNASTYAMSNMGNSIEMAAEDRKQDNKIKPKDISATDNNNSEKQDRSLQEQYTSMKERHPEALLLFGEGDWYVALNDDAKKVSDTLGITLLKPANPKNGEFQATFPHNKIDEFLPRLIRHGFRVAIREQEQGVKKTVSESKNTGYSLMSDIVPEKVLSNLYKVAAAVPRFDRDLVVVRTRDPQTKKNFYAAFGKDANILKIVAPAAATPSFKMGGNIVQVALIPSSWAAKVADKLDRTVYSPVIVNTKGKIIDNDKQLYVAMPKNLPYGGLEFIRDKEKNNPNEVFYNLIQENAQQLARMTKTGERLLRSAFDSKHPYISLHGSDIAAVQRELGMIGNVHTTVWDESGKGVIANDRNFGRTALLAETIKYQNEQKAIDSKPKSDTTDYFGEQKGKVSREPQMITVNGQKVTHAHAFPTKGNPDVYLFTARLDGKQLIPQKMNAVDMLRYRDHKISIPELMQHYYPTKLEKKVTLEEYQNGTKLSDGRTVDKFSMFKDKIPEHTNTFGKYIVYAEVDGKKFVTAASPYDLGQYFDQTKTPAQLTERIFGEKLNLASAYEKYHLPEQVEVSDIRITKEQNGKFNISAQVDGLGRTELHELSDNDRFSFYQTKTASRKQLAAKYLNGEISQMIAVANSQEKKNDRKL